MMIFSSLGSTLITEASANGSYDHEHCIATEHCDDCEDCAGGVDCADCEDCANCVDCAECDDCDHHDHDVAQCDTDFEVALGAAISECQTFRGHVVSSSSTSTIAAMRAGCNHNYQLTQVTAPTCTKAGKKAYICTKCKAQQPYAPTYSVAALGHNFQQQTTKQPTCGTSGTYVTKCTRCGIGSQNGNGTIPATGKHTYNVSAATCTTAKKCTVCGYVAQAALGHNMQQVVTKQATCGASGTYVTKCSRCGAGSANGNGTIPATGKHTYNVSAATCTTAKKCTVCGYVAAAALGHNWNVSAATCTTDKKCTRCGTIGAKATGHTYNVSAADCTTAKKCTKCGTVAQAALGHNMVQVTTKEPTCGAAGTYVTKCSRCGVGSQNGNGSIPATGKHTYNVSAATCTTAKKCTVCGYVAAAALGHNWNVSAATCTTDKKCTRCGTIGAKATGHTYNVSAADCTTAKKCTKCGTVAQAALGHNMVQVTTKEPTCGAGGTYVTKCSRCGIGSQNGNGTIPATGKHTYNVSAATCTTAKKCTVCGYVAEAALGHNWNVSAATCTTDKKCTRCGTVDAKATGHSYNVTAADCTTAKKCTKCGTVAQEALGHNMVQVTTKEPTCGTSGTYVTKCSRCGIGSQNGNGTIPATGKHTYNVSAATCTTAKKCTVCGYVAEAALGHNWNVSAATCTTDKKCTRCGTVDAKATGHSYNVTAADCTTAKKCTKCGYVAQEALGHNMQQVVTKDPTCGEGGTYVTKCSRCGAGSQNGNGTIPATGNHTWELTDTTNATCTVDGKKTYTCSVCKQVKYESIAKLGHDMVQVTSKEPTCGTNGEYVTKCSRCGIGSQNGNGIIPATGKHTFDTEATCTKAKTCTVCGFVGQKALGHDFKQEVIKEPTCGAGGTYVTKCTRCGIGSQNGNGTIPATGKHTYDRDEATCTLDKKCTVCGFVGQKALGHDHQGETIKAPTCTTEGSMKYTCSICGDTYPETLEKMPHYFYWKTVKQPTLETPGQQQYTCDGCKEVKGTRSVGQIVYDGNGGVTAAGDTRTTQLLVPGQASTLAPALFSREGYRFNGWSTDKNAVHGELSANQPGVEFAESTLLYATWVKKNAYTIIYYNGTERYRQYPVVGENVVLQDYMFNDDKLEESDFLGWSTSPNATEAEYGKYQSFFRSLADSADAIIVLFPVLRYKKYTVVYEFENRPVEEKYEIYQRVEFERPYDLNYFTNANHYGVYGWTRVEGSTDPMYVVGNTYDALSCQPGEEIHLYPVYKQVYSRIYWQLGMGDLNFYTDGPNGMKDNDIRKKFFIDEPLILPSSSCVPRVTYGGVTYECIGWSTAWEKEWRNSEPPQKKYTYEPCRSVDIRTWDLTTFIYDNDIIIGLYPVWAPVGETYNVSGTGGVYESYYGYLSYHYNTGDDRPSGDDVTVIQRYDFYLTEQDLAYLEKKVLFSYKINNVQTHYDPDNLLEWIKEKIDQGGTVNTVTGFVADLAKLAGKGGVAVTALGAAGSSYVGMGLLVAAIVANELSDSQNDLDKMDAVMHELVAKLEKIGLFKGDFDTGEVLSTAPVHIVIDFTYKSYSPSSSVDETCLSVVKPENLVDVDIETVEQYDSHIQKPTESKTTFIQRNWYRGEVFSEVFGGFVDQAGGLVDYGNNN